MQVTEAEGLQEDSPTATEALPNETTTGVVGAGAEDIATGPYTQTPEAKK